MIDFEREELATVAVIKEVIDHPNADRLDIVTINEWQCVSAKGTFQKGDKCVYFEIDSILPEDVEGMIFGTDSKVKLKDARVRTIKLRGAISQGLAVPLHAVGLRDNAQIGKDLTKHFSIGKHVPTPKANSVLSVKKVSGRNSENPNFDRMRKPVHFKKVGAFDEPVVITEKIHGTSFVAGWIERPTRTIAQRLNSALFGSHQFCYRSMNVQLQGKDSLFHNILMKIGMRRPVKMSGTLYGRMCEKYDLKNKLAFGHAISAEIYGSGIQDNYTYGCEEGEQKIVGFGFRLNGKELNPESAHSNLVLSGIPTVPVLYVGDFPDDLAPYTTGASILDPKTKVREGCVINTKSGEKAWHGTALIKDINPKYLLKDQSEFN